MTRRPDPAEQYAALVVRLVAARTRAGLTQRELAARLGIALSTLALWETPDLDKRRIPDAIGLHAWANAVGEHLEPSAVAYARGWGDCAAAILGAAKAVCARTDSPDTTESNGD